MFVVTLVGVRWVFLRGFIDVSENLIFYVSYELVQIPGAPWEDLGSRGGLWNVSVGHWEVPGASPGGPWGIP